MDDPNSKNKPCQINMFWVHGSLKTLDNHLKKTEKLWCKHTWDGGKLALSDFVPAESIEGQSLRPRGANNCQAESKNVGLCQVTVVLQK